MIRFFAAHPTAANLLMVLLFAMGVFAIPALRRETFPKIPPKEIEIQVVYPGAATADVEDSVCGRIEDAIDGVDGIAEIRSEALESIGRVTVEIAPGADPRVVLDDLRTEVDAIDDFPARVEDPIIRQLGRTDKVAAIAVTGDLAVPDLKALCEDLRRELRNDDDVRIVDVLGFSDHQLRVEIPMTVLLQFGLSAADIADAIESQNIDLPAGEVQTPDGDVLIRFTDERRTPAELEQLVVLVSDTGAEITLGDIATIEDRFELAEDKLLFNDRRAGLLDVKKTEEQDSLTILTALRRFIDHESARLPSGCELALTQDQASIVADRLSMLIKNGLQGLLLVFVTLWLFFSFRLSFWVAAGLPVSFLGALFFMAQIGYSINMMTMVALLLALGLLMDDSIVLAENVATHRRDGKSALEAAIGGVTEVRVGILSSFATTLAVFVPLSFLDGDIGVVLKVIPVVLILVLSVSLIEAFLILPAHLGHALHQTGEGGRFRRAFDGRMEWLRERVGRLADAFVEHRYLAVGAGLAALIVSLGMLAGRSPAVSGAPVGRRRRDRSEGPPAARHRALAHRGCGRRDHAGVRPRE